MSDQTMRDKKHDQHKSVADGTSLFLSRCIIRAFCNRRGQGSASTSHTSARPRPNRDRAIRVEWNGWMNCSAVIEQAEVRQQYRVLVVNREAFVSESD